MLSFLSSTQSSLGPAQPQSSGRKVLAKANLASKGSIHAQLNAHSFSLPTVTILIAYSACSLFDADRYELVVGKLRISLNSVIDIHPKPLALQAANRSLPPMTIMLTTKQEGKSLSLQFVGQEEFEFWQKQLSVMVANLLCASVLTPQTPDDSPPSPYPTSKPTYDLSESTLNHVLSTCSLLVSTPTPLWGRVEQLAALVKRIDVVVESLSKGREVCQREVESLFSAMKQDEVLATHPNLPLLESLLHATHIQIPIAQPVHSAPTTTSPMITLNGQVLRRSDGLNIAGKGGETPSPLPVRTLTMKQVQKNGSSTQASSNLISKGKGAQDKAKDENSENGVVEEGKRPSSMPLAQRVVLTPCQPTSSNKPTSASSSLQIDTVSMSTSHNFSPNSDASVAFSSHSEPLVLTLMPSPSSLSSPEQVEKGAAEQSPDVRADSNHSPSPASPSPYPQPHIPLESSELPLSSAITPPSASSIKTISNSQAHIAHGQANTYLYIICALLACLSYSIHLQTSRGPYSIPISSASSSLHSTPSFPTHSHPNHYTHSNIHNHNTHSSANPLDELTQLLCTDNGVGSSSSTSYSDQSAYAILPDQSNRPDARGGTLMRQSLNPLLHLIRWLRSLPQFFSPQAIWQRLWKGR